MYLYCRETSPSVEQTGNKVYPYNIANFGAC
jgi:hypothetical protein